MAEVLSALVNLQPLWGPSVLGGQISQWMRADSGITLNGSAVSAWQGKGSGGGNQYAGPTLVQATAADQPAYVAADSTANGRPTLNFTSNVMGLYASTSHNLFGGFSSVARYVVFKLPSQPAANGTIINSSIGSSTSGRFTIYASATSGEIYWTVRVADADAATSAACPSGSIVYGAWNVLSVWRNGATVTITLNGVLLTTTTLSLSDAANSFPNTFADYEGVGSESGGGGVVMSLAEAGTILNPTQDTIDHIHGYAAWWYGFQTQLAAAHPYRLAPPLTRAGLPIPGLTTYRGSLVTTSTWATIAASADSDIAAPVQSITQDGTYLYVAQESTEGVNCDCQIYSLATKALVTTALKAVAPHSACLDYMAPRGSLLSSSAGDATIVATVYETTINPTSGAITQNNLWDFTKPDTNGVTLFAVGACCAYVGPYDGTSFLAMIFGPSAALAPFTLVRMINDGTYTFLAAYYSADVGINQDCYYDQAKKLLVQLQTNNSYVDNCAKAFSFGPLQSAAALPYAVGYATMVGYYVSTDGSTNEAEGICLNPAGGIFWGQSNLTIKTANLV